MSEVIEGVVLAALTLGWLGLLAAVLLYVISRTFAVEENEKLNEVLDLLPNVNCGACGFPGCKGFAEALVQGAEAGSIDGLYCPPGGPDGMAKIGEYLELKAGAGHASLAVCRCGGSKEKSPRTRTYDGPKSCSVSHSLFAGDKGCPFGCIGFGDCVDVCDFDAIHIDPETLLPVIDEEKCTSCGKCVKACPRIILEVRPKGRRNKRIWVNCRSEEKGAAAKKHCSVACIGCAKCAKVCPVDAITVVNNLAYIDPNKCISCGKCHPVCPTQAITANFDPPKPKNPKEATT
jgi:electron transport complex protein RnfB